MHLDHMLREIEFESVKPADGGVRIDKHFDLFDVMAVAAMDLLDGVLR